MSFDPSFQYTEGIGAGVNNGPTIDPAEDPTKNEYYAQRMQTPPWILAGFPDYASYAANLRQKEELARALQEKQIHASSGVGAAGVSASISANAANQRAAAQNEIDRAKMAADEAHNAALLALQQGNAAEARRQFDISSKELERYHSADIALRQQDQQLASAKFGNDVYNKLADLASNPRNYMEQFFRMRGQEPPAGSAAYGNTSVTGPGLATFQQFLPQFLRSTGLAGGGYGYTPPQTQTAAPAATAQTSKSIPVGPGGAISDWAVKNGYSADTSAQQFGGQKTTADTAMINGVPTWAGGPYSGMAVDKAPANAGDLTPYLKNPNAPDPTGRIPQFAHGGSLTMTAPHAIVNLLSGKVAAIAGEERGKGPHGYVPETAKFDGKAIIDPKTGVAPIDPNPQIDPSSPTSTFPTASSIKTPGGGLAYPYDPTTATGPGPDPSFQVPPQDIGAPITPTPSSSTPTPTATPFTMTAAQQAQLQADIAAANAANAARNKVPTPPPPPIPPPVPPPLQQQTQAQIDAANAAAQAQAQAQAQAAAAAEAQRIANLPSGIAPGPVTTTAPNPGPAPAPVVTPTNIPNPSSSFDSLFSTPSGIGKNPKFLPEDMAAQDPIIAEMLKAGTFPPFLQRIFAQSKGLAGLGTNVPQATDLPPGVPLVSKLAYSQFTPAERSAFESFLSAHGLDLPTYLSLVEAASPQGGPSPKNPAIPRFLAQ